MSGRGPYRFPGPSWGRRPPQTRSDKVKEAMINGVLYVSLFTIASVLVVVTSPILVPLLVWEAGDSIKECVVGQRGACKARKKTRGLQQQRERERLQPEIKSRERALTRTGIRVGEAAGNSGSVPMRMKSQAQCRLLALPSELRNQIYEEVIGKEEIHVILLDGKLCSFRCRHPEFHTRRYGPEHCWVSSFDENKRFLHRHKYHNPGIEVIPFLQSCRRIYNETITLLYAAPTFLLHDAPSILAFTSTILPKRFASIRHLHIDTRHRATDWPLTWSFIGDFTYRSLHALSLPVLNPIPSSLPFGPSLRLSTPLGPWYHVCYVLRKMRGLRVLQMDLEWDTLWNTWDDQLARYKPERCVLGPLIGNVRPSLTEYEVRFTFLPDDLLYWTRRPFVSVEENDIWEE
ncbi:hypothetical protein BDV95DRAFT_69989 [Massariosphaeria phaeospora]|uniref:DUF7730 domain-containing protein n=1 Tax=Massariosphaeria phaeospora TaxID=100035 RepID=A0A7C8M990_9PLEO|nr:hypothetical protein BDV95DRAFT_69989 [Massariosphaeria phaeospora]